MPEIPSGPGAGTNVALRGLSNDLRDASDSTILRVTQVIDTLADRGAADRLLDGVRPRLMELRPPRPRGLGRVLFVPLDPVIVPPAAWRPGSAAIPRSVIAPVTVLLRAHLPDIASTEASLAAGKKPDGRLWNDAAAILRRGPLPAEWSLPAFQVETGIKPQALPPLLGVIGLVFAHAALLSSEQEPAREELRPLLLEAARAGPSSWSIVLALLLEKTAAPAMLIERVLALVQETSVARQLEAGLQSVIATVVDRLDHAAPEQAQSDDELDAQARRAARLAGFGALHGEMQGFARRLTERKRQMAAQCASQLARGLSDAATACVPAGRLAPQAEQEAAERLEARLRSLRRLDLAARPLGNAQGRDQLLADAAAAYAGDGAPGWMTQADRLRLCEILVGAEAALRLMQQEGRVA